MGREPSQCTQQRIGEAFALIRRTVGLGVDVGEVAVEVEHAGRRAVLAVHVLEHPRGIAPLRTFHRRRIRVLRHTQLAP
jgi:hypothetical protein